MMISGPIIILYIGLLILIAGTLIPAYLKQQNSISPQTINELTYKKTFRDTTPPLIPPDGYYKLNSGDISQPGDLIWVWDRFIKMGSTPVIIPDNVRVYRKFV